MTFKPCTYMVVSSGGTKTVVCPSQRELVTASLRAHPERVTPSSSAKK